MTWGGSRACGGGMGGGGRRKHGEMTRSAGQVALFINTWGEVAPRRGRSIENILEEKAGRGLK